MRVQDLGLGPETVAERHVFDVADVYHALAYDHDHPEEMEAVEERRAKAIESARAMTTILPPDER